MSRKLHPPRQAHAHYRCSMPVHLLSNKPILPARLRPIQHGRIGCAVRYHRRPPWATRATLVPGSFLSFPTPALLHPVFYPSNLHAIALFFLLTPQVPRCGSPFSSLNPRLSQSICAALSSSVLVLHSQKGLIATLLHLAPAVIDRSNEGKDIPSRKSFPQI